MPAVVPHATGFLSTGWSGGDVSRSIPSRGGAHEDPSITPVRALELRSFIVKADQDTRPGGSFGDMVSSASILTVAG